MNPPYTTMDQIMQKYQTILFDAFGVLVDAKGVLPHAIELINYLNTTNKNYFILTNGARFSLQESAQKYLDRGLAIPTEKVISSGSLLESWIVEKKLVGKRCFVVGPQSSRSYISNYGVQVVANDEESFDGLIVADQGELNFPEDLDRLITLLFKKLLHNKNFPMALPNPDIIYPASENSFGFTSGGIVLMLEAALDARFPDHSIRFDRLGKPFAPIFARAEELSGSKDMILIGDQITTDIAGAYEYGIDSALIATGVSDLQNLNFSKVVNPTWLLQGLEFRS